MPLRRYRAVTDIVNRGVSRLSNTTNWITGLLNVRFSLLLVTIECKPKIFPFGLCALRLQTAIRHNWVLMDLCCQQDTRCGILK
jgi:hypothetical protein